MVAGTHRIVGASNAATGAENTYRIVGASNAAIGAENMLRTALVLSAVRMGEMTHLRTRLLHALGAPLPAALGARRASRVLHRPRRQRASARLRLFRRRAGGRRAAASRPV
jgi:hypothetical protein